MKYSWIVKPFFWFQKKRYGSVLPPTWEWAKAPRVMFSFLAFYKSLTRKSSPIPADLRAMVGLHVAQMVSCSFCMDFNASRLKRKEITLPELADFQKSSLFSDKEKSALEYAEMMVRGEVDSRIRETLKLHFSEAAIVELTAFIGCQLLSSRFNLILGVQSAECLAVDIPKAD